MDNLKKCLIWIAITLRLNLSTAFWGVSSVQALQLRGPHLEGNHPTRVFFSGDLSSFPPLSSHSCFPAYSPLPHPSPHNCMEEGSVPNSVSSWMAGWGPDGQASLGTEGQPGGLDPNRKFSSDSTRELLSLCCGTHAGVSTAPDGFSVLMPS